MSPLDASFLHMEDGISHMTIASCAIFDGPAPAFEELRAMTAGKLHLMPRYRQRVHFVPFELGRPVWVDDPHFNLDFHLRHTSLPAPGSMTQLKTLFARLMSGELDRNRPLWESWIVEGLEDGHWAMISKTHHCMVDGVSGTDLLSVMLDADPAAPIPEAQPWEPEPEPSEARLVFDALADLGRSPYEQMRAWRAAWRTPAEALRTAADAASGLLSYIRQTQPVEASSLNGSIGPHRRWTWTSASLADVKTIRTAFGGTVNDVVLAAISRGFRDLLLTRDEVPEAVEIHTLVPVNIRPHDAAMTYDNKVGAIIAHLPVGIEGAEARLAAVHQQMEALKQSGEVAASEVFSTLSEALPPALVAFGMRAAAQFMRRNPQRNVNTVTTNVPGPQYPLYSLGRRMVTCMPFVPLSHGVRIGVAIVSYDGQLTFGVTGDWDTAPDIDVLARGIEDGVEELVKLAEAKLGGQ